MANGKEDDEIKELPLKERLEYQKIQAETYALKKPFLTKSSVIWTIITVVLTIAIFIATGYFSDWFSVRLKKLENKKILIDAETKILEYKKSLLIQDTEKVKIEKEKLATEKNKLVLETENLKHEKDLLVEKYAKLDEKYKEKSQKLEEKHDKEITALKEEYAKKNKELKKAFEDISSFGNWYSRGAGEFVDGKYEEAIDSFTKALEVKPDKNSAAYTHNYIGLSNARRGELKESIESFTKAIEIYTEYAVAYKNRGYVYFQLKEYGNAFEDFNKAIASFIIKGEYKKAKLHIEDVSQGLKGVKADEKFDENMKKSVEDDIDILKERLEEAKRK